MHTILKLTSLGVIVSLPVGLVAQSAPPTLPDTEVPPDYSVPDVHPEIPPEVPPIEIQEFVAALQALQTEFLAVVQGEYASGDERAAAIQDWLDVNQDTLDAVEALKTRFEGAAGNVVLPDTELVGDLVMDIEGFEAAEKALEESLGAVLAAPFVSEEERAAAIEQWKSEHAGEIAAQEAARIDILAQIEEARANAGNLGERPEVSQNMVDLQALLEEKLAVVLADNEALKEKLAAAEQDREERLRLLEEARQARLEKMEEARELARQQREEARQNIGGNRRPDDGEG